MSRNDCSATSASAVCVCACVRVFIRAMIFAIKTWGEGTGTWAKEIKLNSQSFVCVINTTYREYV